MKKGEIQMAMNDCEKVIYQSPKNVTALYMRGCCHEKLGEVEKGI